MKKRSMKILSALLSLMLVFQAIPAGVFANEIPAEEQGTAIVEETKATETPIELKETIIEETNNNTEAQPEAPVEEKKEEAPAEVKVEEKKEEAPKTETKAAVQTYQITWLN